MTQREQHEEMKSNKKFMNKTKHFVKIIGEIDEWKKAKSRILWLDYPFNLEMKSIPENPKTFMSCNYNYSISVLFSLMIRYIGEQQNN